MHFLNCMSCVSQTTTQWPWFGLIVQFWMINRSSLSVITTTPFTMDTAKGWHSFFPQSPDLIFSSKHSIFGHTDKERSIKTTKLHFFLGESYLINQRLGEERINVCSRWGENHLRKQGKRNWRLRERVSARLSMSEAATCHFSTMAQNPLGKGKPGELFRRPSPLSEWSLQSGPLEFLHHVI